MTNSPLPTIVALIPARAGSKRLPRKCFLDLGGKPLIAWTIGAAKESGVFDDIVVASDAAEAGDIAKAYGVNFFTRPPSPDDESDITWIKYIFAILHGYDAFAILRPTNPFRTADTIRRAWRLFLASQPCDSLRAVEKVSQHPGKMWVVRQNRLLPLLPFENSLSPWHSSATQTLPPVYAQNASLEIAWVKIVLEQGTIAGTAIVPFFTEGREGIDIHGPGDFEKAERLIKGGVQYGVSLH